MEGKAKVFKKGPRLRNWPLILPPKGLLGPIFPRKGFNFLGNFSNQGRKVYLGWCSKERNYKTSENYFIRKKNFFIGKVSQKGYIEGWFYGIPTGLILGFNLRLVIGRVKKGFFGENFFFPPSKRIFWKGIGWVFRKRVFGKEGATRV